jgi:hypothetical protein
MSATRKLLAVAVAAPLLVALSALTRVPWTASDADRALLRLSWRARGEEIEACRRATEAELANVPAHMRQEVVCTGARVAPYTLRVALDGREVLAGPVAGSDVPGDRPMYLLHDLPLAPGVHRVSVRFERRGPGAARDEDDDSPRGRHRRAIPPRLVLDTTIVAAAGDVVLVTYSAELERLVVMGSARR